MVRKEPRNRKWRNIRPGVLSVLFISLLPAAVYLLGAVWIWNRREAAKALTESIELASPVIGFVLEHIFPVYLAAGAAALLVISLYPFSRKAAEEKLRQTGLVNHEGDTPRLLRKRRDRKHPYITMWEFDNRGIPLKEWEAKREKVETALNLNIVDLAYGKGKRRVLLYAVPARTGLPSQLPWKDAYLSADSFVLTLGESLLGKVTVNLAHIPHILLGGSTGSGKSVLLKLLLMQCVKKGAKVYIADFKGGVDFPAAWHDVCRLCFDADALLELLTALVEELQRRKRLFREIDCANIDEYNRRAEKGLQRYIFTCDEVAEVLDKTGLTKEEKEKVGRIESRLAVIARQGRAFGIHLILATQRPDANIIPGQIKSNLDFRVCGRADSVLSQIILDSTAAADQIPKEARGRFITVDGIVFQAYIQDENRL